MCPKLKEEDASEPRANINALLRKGKAPKPDLNKHERIALSQLKKDQDRVILTVDKGVALVVLDKDDYINKAWGLLSQPAYKEIPKNPTNRIKAQLITKLRRIKKDSNNNNENINNNNQDSCPTINRQANKATVGQVVIPYTKGIAKGIKQTCGKYGIQVHFKGNTTIKQVLMKPKDQDPKDSKSGLIYSCQCDHWIVMRNI